MHNRTTNTGSNRARPKKSRAWLRQKLAELRAAVAKLPAERREQLKRELEEGRGR
jgi:hypothetical protein